MRKAKIVALVIVVVLVAVFVGSAGAATAVERFQVGGVKSELNARTLETRFQNVPGVKDASVSSDGEVKVRFDSTKTSGKAIRETVERLGYTVSEKPSSPRRAFACC